MDSGRRGLFFDASTAAANSHGNMLFLGSHDPILRDSRSFFSSEDSSKKRPFFTCSDEFVEEEYYDEQSQDKKRRLTTEQVRLLEKSFETENKLEPERKTQLANKLGLQPRQVAVWFQNRRARWKTKQLERDYDLLKASYDSLRSDFDLIVHENEKLKSEVASLSEKLQEKDASGMKVDQIPHPLIPTEANVEDFTGVELNVKAEDRLSSKSGGSAVVDDDVLQLVDSVDSYFPGSDYCDCIGPVNGVQSDGEDISEDSRNGFSEFLMQTVEHNHQEEAEALGWWVWA